MSLWFGYLYIRRRAGIPSVRGVANRPALAPYEADGLANRLPRGHTWTARDNELDGADFVTSRHRRLLSLAAGRRRLVVAVASTLVAALILVGVVERANVPRAGCALVASPLGSDSAPGSLHHPLHTVQKLIDSLRPGQTGCLLAGVYGGRNMETRFSHPGVTIRSYPGERATIAGWPYVSGAGSTLAYLNFDLNDVDDPSTHCARVGTMPHSTYSLQIEANDVAVEHSDVYQSNVRSSERSVGIGVGWNERVSGVIIRYDRIHDVGSCPVLDHAVYLDQVSAARVYGNWIYDVADGVGVQLWDSTANSHIYSNVIDGASSGFTLGCCAKARDVPTHGNLIEHNLVTNSVGAHIAGTDAPPLDGPDPSQTIWTHWTASRQTGNVYRDNLAFCAPGRPDCGTNPGSTEGLIYTGNIVADPQYLDAAAHDYRVAATSPAASWGLWNGDLPTSR